MTGTLQDRHGIDLPDNYRGSYEGVIMSAIAYCRGSKHLAGAASMKYGVPATGGRFPFPNLAQWIERQPDALLVAGSNPAVPANL